MVLYEIDVSVTPIGYMQVLRDKIEGLQIDSYTNKGQISNTTNERNDVSL